MKRRAGAIPLLSLIARAPMRYLQTACGAPQHPGGARWFPDSITVTVPFTQEG